LLRFTDAAQVAGALLSDSLLNALARIERHTMRRAIHACSREVRRCAVQLIAWMRLGFEVF
jgi:hypothetical protein